MCDPETLFTEPAQPKRTASNALRPLWGGALLLALAACGGDDPAADNATVAAFQVGETALLVNEDVEAPARARVAEAIGAGAQKTAYTLGGHLGVYGQALVQDGWELRGLPAAGLPSGRGVVLYVNIDAPLAAAAALRRQLQDFSGVIVVDSDVRAEQAANPGADASDPEAAAERTRLAVLGRVQANELPRPRASATVIARRVGIAYDLEVSSDGAVNGVASAERELSGVNLLLTVGHNLLAASDVPGDGRVKALAADAGGFSADVGGIAGPVPVGVNAPARVPPPGFTFIYDLLGTSEWHRWNIRHSVMTARQVADVRAVKPLMASLSNIQTTEVVKAVLANRRLNGGNGITHTGKPAQAVDLLRLGTNGVSYAQGVARTVERSRYTINTDPDVLWLRSLLAAGEMGYFNYLKDTYLRHTSEHWNRYDEWHRRLSIHFRFIVAYRQAQQAGGPIPPSVKENFERAQRAMNPVYREWETAGVDARAVRLSLEGIKWRMTSIHQNFNRSIGLEVAAVINAGGRRVEGPPMAIQLPYLLQ
jgi:hypothetical protein